MPEATTYIFYGIQGAQDLITTWAPIIISCASLIVALAAVWLTRKQVEIIECNNKIMTKPNLDIWLYTNHRNEDDSRDILRLELKNNGIGPAIIRKMTVKAADVTIKESHSIVYAAQEIFNTLMDNCFAGGKLHSGEYLAAGDSIPLLRVQNLGVTPDKASSVISEKLQILIEYQSVYGETFLYDFQNIHGIQKD